MVHLRRKLPINQLDMTNFICANRNALPYLSYDMQNYIKIGTSGTILVSQHEELVKPGTYIPHYQSTIIPSTHSYPWIERMNI